MALDSTFWVAVSFFIFFGGLVYLKVPQKVNEILNKLILDIKNEIDESEKSGAKVDVNDEGVVTVAAPDEESRNIAMQMIKDITAKAELNKIYSGKVMKIMEFGAFVNFLGKQDGLVHISELAPKRVEKVTDVVKEGDEVKVKVIGFDRGKVKLSMKQAAE